MKISAPQYELTRVYADGASDPPQIVPLSHLKDAQTDRRGFLKAGLAASVVLSMIRPAKGGVAQSASTTPDWDQFIAHKDSVKSVVFSPDGKQLASGSVDTTVKFWNISDGALLKTLSGHTAGVASVAFSADGKLLASGSEDKTIKLWSIPDGALLNTLAWHTNAVESVAFSPDGKLLASGSKDQTIRLWSVPEGNLLNTLHGHTAAVNAVVFTSDSKWMASASEDYTVRLWNVADGKCRNTLEGHSLGIKSVAFSPDGKQLASASADKTIKRWSVPDGKLISTFGGYLSGVNSNTFSPDGKLLASGSGDKSIKLWNASKGLLLKTLIGPPDGVNSVAFSPDSKLLASGGADKSVKLWSMPDGKLIRGLLDVAVMPQLDLSKEAPSVKGSTFTVQGESGRARTYTLPCGSPIPPGAVCTCNCVPGSYAPPSPTPSSGGGSYESGGSYCSCNKVCTCVPVYVSDQDTKENIMPVAGGEILQKLGELPIALWNYKQDAVVVRHIGPMAQEFAAVFQVGDSDQHIHTADGIGVALASIQELHRLVLAQQRELAELRQALGLKNAKS